MSVSNCSLDENGKASGGRAGDQTGREWLIQAWYDKGWTHCFRYPSSTVRECISQLAEEAARNDKIGYDQNQRTTFWSKLKNSGYHPKNITEACEADCSSGVAAIVKSTGYLLGIPKLQNVSVDMYTGSQINTLSQAGFQVLTDSKYLTSDKYLLRGDILLKKGSHTLINLTDGSQAEKGGWHWLKSDGIWYYQDADGINSYGWKIIPSRNTTTNYKFYFNSKGQMVTGSQWIDGEYCCFMDRGDLEGAMCKTDDKGYQHPWAI